MEDVDPPQLVSFDIFVSVYKIADKQYGSGPFYHTATVACPVLANAQRITEFHTPMSAWAITTQLGAANCAELAFGSPGRAFFENLPHAYGGGAAGTEMTLRW